MTTPAKAEGERRPLETADVAPVVAFVLVLLIAAIGWAVTRASTGDVYRLRKRVESLEKFRYGSSDRIGAAVRLAVHEELATLDAEED